MINNDDVVMLQSRFQIANEHCADFGVWYKWEEVDQAKYDDIQRSIDKGAKNYELRKLVVKN
tara:strand:- start:2160 stop:2345 length:186 start_codon:yes stop_codon:yes gene_type:complete